MKRFLPALAILALLGGASPAAAHPGHGLAPRVSSFLHWATSPDHAGVIVLAVFAAAGVVLVRKVRTSDTE